MITILGRILPRYAESCRITIFDDALSIVYNLPPLYSKQGMHPQKHSVDSSIGIALARTPCKSVRAYKSVPALASHQHSSDVAHAVPA